MNSIIFAPPKLEAKIIERWQITNQPLKESDKTG